MTEASVVANFLVRSLQQADPRPLKGSELSVLAKTTYPDFKPEKLGFRKLRDFIRTHAPDIVEYGKAGMDIVYVLRSTKEQLIAEGQAAKEGRSPVDQLTANPRIWKTFTRPDSIFKLFLMPDGEVRVLHPNQKPLPEWREIPGISAETLLQIGRDFTADLPDLQKAILAPILDDPKWWIPYFERLQTLGLRSKWVEFRRRRVRDEFARLIASAGMHIEPAPAISQPIKLQADLPSKTQSESAIRRIAAEVVQRMTESELRSLNLPLGYVVDSLTTR